MPTSVIKPVYSLSMVGLRCLMWCSIGMLSLPIQANNQDESSALAQLTELQRLENKKQRPERHGSKVDEEHMMREQAFNKMLEEVNPLSPDQIRRLRDDYERTFEAIETPTGIPPKPLATSQFVNLSPGATPPVVRLASGFVSSLVFLDSAGAPWPVSAYSLGQTKYFQIQWNGKDHVLVIQAKKLHAHGNLSVRLQGLSTPVMITLLGQKQPVVDYRVDFRVQGYGPHTQNIPSGDDLPGSESEVLLGVLDGIPPAGSEAYHVDDRHTSVWQSGSTMFVRTRHKLLSPGWMSSLSSADGTRAYQMTPTPHLLVSFHGRVKALKIEQRQG